MIMVLIKNIFFRKLWAHIIIVIFLDVLHIITKYNNHKYTNQDVM